jgi:hypothetical protein
MLTLLRITTDWFPKAGDEEGDDPVAAGKELEGDGAARRRRRRPTFTPPVISSD